MNNERFVKLVGFMLYGQQGAKVNCTPGMGRKRWFFILDVVCGLQLSTLRNSTKLHRHSQVQSGAVRLSGNRQSPVSLQCALVVSSTNAAADADAVAVAVTSCRLANANCLHIGCMAQFQSLWARVCDFTFRIELNSADNG